MTPSRSSRILGCLMGGGVGDALGAPAEFLSLREIREKYGPAGITTLAGNDYVRAGDITDDTQISLFTAEGLIRAHVRWLDRGICDPPTVIYHAYLRWLHTQGGKVDEELLDGWLVSRPELHHRRAPGRTCLNALSSGRMGTREDRINDSKGCGGVMRVAPVGLIADDPFSLGCETAAITHGHPSGFLAAGALALMIKELLGGRSIEEALQTAVERLTRELAASTSARDLPPYSCLARYVRMQFEGAVLQGTLRSPEVPSAGCEVE